MTYVYDESGIGGYEFAVAWDGARSAVFSMPRGATHAIEVDSFDGTVGGLSLAIYRVRYLARGVTKNFAAESVAIAEKIVALGPVKAARIWEDS